MSERIPVGVDAVGVYCGSAVVDVAELFAARGLDPARLANLGMRHKSVAAAGEDVVAVAATAARPVVDALPAAERSRIRGVLVATESAVDLSRSAAAPVHELLELPRHCRLVEVKQACHGGVAALRLAAALVATEPGSTVLVVAADVPVPGRGTYMEPSQGVGAVAALVTEHPRLLTLDPGPAGCHGYAAADFFRPAADVDVMDTDLSLLSYLDCLVGAFTDYAARNPGADLLDSFDLLAMHTPFPGMVRGAHRSALRKLTGAGPGAVPGDFDRRVAPSLRLPERVGNIYSATTLLAVLSAVLFGPDDADRLGVFSYGSGCAAEFLAARVVPGARERLAALGIDRELAARTPLPVAEYDAAVDRSRATGFGARDARPEPDELAGWGAGDRPRAVLTGIRDHRRAYAWLPAR
ncbi:polyketide biosynthesis 3-hydroxy-3-methylglutaryl-CoA synthase-like enzyme PksG [Amycolatopsis arida]|uniref:Polyketide biosynthesis 3-hydroxy-3-methylglutaryl-CoA synthase-like enzyme PksG n=1 Tax=Amycolatopsis arida TaxID=587909 RepID=A0A1I6AKE9_9PSEU|nr:hydroxymethylglutaryl-CoA synthase [Amycolatopsis arida]TDX87345.1 polyketide biosynthesis 3-hydroxy-3-methylglutaryl-CoA synthase-like enzyme PksG [Amycolatopsis arida]SFQ69120.1 polyketide biosynthesis 3-hydroxy-3-methylglutaryl-CoA synthase-like enzyme PksG [Amycolatopsis arida]